MDFYETHKTFTRNKKLNWLLLVVVVVVVRINFHYSKAVTNDLLPLMVEEIIHVYSLMKMNIYSDIYSEIY